MPCHKISLFVFEDEKQNRLEEFWNHFFELKKNKIEEKKSKKIKKQEEKIKKQQEIEKQKEKERKKQRAKSNKKQTDIFDRRFRNRSEGLQSRKKSKSANKLDQRSGCDARSTFTFHVRNIFCDRGHS